MELVSSNEFGQLFITDTHPQRLAELFNTSHTNYKNFYIEKNNVREVSESGERITERTVNKSQ
jgi:hypothetical protein